MSAAKDIVNLFERLPQFVPAVGWKQVGERAFSEGDSFDDRWPDDMRIGYIRALSHTADAETSAWLVSRGEVS